MLSWEYTCASQTNRAKWLSSPLSAENLNHHKENNWHLALSGEIFSSSGRLKMSIKIGSCQSGIQLLHRTIRIIIWTIIKSIEQLENLLWGPWLVWGQIVQHNFPAWLMLDGKKVRIVYDFASTSNKLLMVSGRPLTPADFSHHLRRSEGGGRERGFFVSDQKLIYLASFQPLHWIERKN